MTATWHGRVGTVMLVALLGGSGCSHEILGPSAEQLVAVEYRVEGGVAGSHAILRITSPDTARFQGAALGGDYDVSMRLSLKQFARLQSAVRQNLPGLQAEYLPANPWADDLWYTLRVTYGDHTQQTVSATGHGEPPRAFWTITSVLDGLIAGLTTQATEGRIFVVQSAALLAWPFTPHTRLAEQPVYRDLVVGRDIFTHFQTLFLERRAVVHYEETWLYEINTSSGFGVRYENLPGFTIRLSPRFRPVVWPATVGRPLAGVGPEGVRVTGSAYTQLKLALAGPNSPYVMEGPLQDGVGIYRLHLIHRTRSETAAPE